MYSSIFFLFFSLSICNELDENILVKIKDRKITKNDFIKRSEYTIRPNYLKGQNNIEKKIILNSLIAEKLMAIEIEEGYLSNKYTNNFIEGYKEQLMRESFLENEIYNSIVIDSLEVNNYFNNISNHYNVQFLSIKDSDLSSMVDSLLENGKEFHQICENFLNLKEIPNRKINFFEEPDPFIIESVFFYPLSKNQVIGPIKTKDKKKLYLKVLGWETNPPITMSEKTKLWIDVKDKLYILKRILAYDDFTSTLMKNQKMEIFEKPFLDFLNFYYEKFFDSINNKKILNWDSSLLNEKMLNIDLDEQFLVVNDEKYTVGDIQKLIEKHPLVFRKDQISKSEFPMHLKYAIADLLRDEKITSITYLEKYDEKHHIKKDVSILRDAIMFKLHLRTYLEGKNISNDDFNENYENVINDHLNKYYDNLIEKYNNEIKINYSLLKEIKLTGIDLYAYKKGYPYPFVVPDFPIITNKFELNFGVDIKIP